MKTSVFLPLLLFTITGNAQQPESSRIKELERKLDQATRQLDQLNEVMQSLRAEIAFFPGQRDRGLTLFGDLNFTALKNVHYFIGAFNGARFFADNNRQANYVLRLRKLFDRPKLAVGVSAQLGKQILPPGVKGADDENLIGMDFQYVIGRLGLRGEIVAGATPSTLLGIEPEFADAFSPGAKSVGGALFATWRLTGRDHVYARYDQFNRDPVKGYNVRAFNIGYLRYLGEMTRIGVDYQFKNRPSFNDDAVNGRFHITWSIEF